MAKIRLFGVDLVVPSNDGNEDAIIRLFGVDVVASCNNKEDGASMVRVYNPIPLRMCPPMTGKRKQRTTMGREKKKPRVTKDEDEYGSAPVIPPELQRVLEQHQGATEPVFLYEKKLEQSDTLRSQNRLFINKKGRFKKFLNEQEWSLIGTGIEKIPCVDAQGKNYTLSLKVWESLGKLVIKSGWYKLLNENSMGQGDWAQIWGYREEGRICFAINFKRA